MQNKRWEQGGGQDVILKIKIGLRKVKTCQFGSAKTFWTSIWAQVAEGGKRQNKAKDLPDKSKY
jgi:hypothetical protein